MFLQSVLEATALSSYFPRFVEHGFVDERAFRTLNDADLKNLIGMDKIGERRSLLAHIEHLAASASPSVTHGT